MYVGYRDCRETRTSLKREMAKTTWEHRAEVQRRAEGIQQPERLNNSRLCKPLSRCHPQASKEFPPSFSSCCTNTHMHPFRECDIK